MFRLALVVATVLVASSVQANNFQFDRTYAGSAGALGMDTNADLVPVEDWILSGRGRYGRSTSRVRLEFDFVPDPGGICPAGSFLLGLSDTFAHTSVETFKKGTQLFVTFESGEACISVSATAVTVTTFTLTGTIVGGSGRFAGASGSLTATGTVADLVPFRLGSVGWVSVEETATFSTP